MQGPISSGPIADTPEDYGAPPPATQAGFVSLRPAGLRRMGAVSGGGPTGARALFMPLLGVA